VVRVVDRLLLLADWGTCPSQPDAAEEVGAGGLGKAPAVGLLGAVEDLSLVGDADQALEAERTAQHVLGEALAAGDVVGVEPDGAVDRETRVVPGPLLPHERLVDLAALEEQVEDLAPPQLLEGFAVELGQRDERAVGGKRAVGPERVQMRVEAIPPTLP
jgi:hypothetical protein